MDIIDNYRRLTIGKYTQILALSKDEDLEELDKQVGILAILTDRSEDELLHLPIPQYTALVRRMEFLGNPELPKERISKKYILGGFDLVPVTDFRKIETCQYVDFQTFVADMDAHIVEILSVLLVPKGMRYNEGYDIIEVQQAIREELSVSEAMTLLAFFCASSLTSIKDSLNFCKRMAKGLPKEKRQIVTKEADRLLMTLTGNGDGSPM